MKFLMLALLITSFSAFSADKKIAATATTSKAAKTKVTNDSQPGTLDVEGSSKTKEITDETALMTDKHVVKSEVTCKAKDGHEMKKGDKGFEECIQRAKTDKKDTDVNVKFEK